MLYSVAASHQALVRSVLERPETFEWTTQGFGMIRTYLDHAKRWRLNIWDDRLAIPNVSDIHDHPWDFKSCVIAGELQNTRYAVYADDLNITPTHAFHRIETGEGIDDRRRSQPELCVLRQYPVAVLPPGSTYAQHKEEVHRTTYLRGTVTLNDRTPPTKAHTARVFWPYGGEWVNAMPREATLQERDDAIAAALVQIGALS